MGLGNERTSKLMRIAGNNVLRNPQYHPRLPLSENILIRLADVDAATLEPAIRSGTVHPAMTEAEASDFASRSPKTNTQREAISWFVFDGNHKATILADHILEDLARWPLHERWRAAELLTAMAEQIKADAQAPGLGTSSTTTTLSPNDGLTLAAMPPQTTDQETHL